jgi:SAM-dependent methyltransferase
METPPRLFAAARVRAHRARAAEAFADAAFLHARAAQDCADRLEEINRRFARAVAFGGGAALASALSRRALADKLGLVISADAAPALLAEPPGVACDPEAWPFAAGSLDLIVSMLSLHWANDLPGALVQARLSLAPDGLFLGVLFGARTLQELRACLLEAEAQVTGGASLRIAPLVEIRDLGGLLQRAGLALPVTDADLVTVRYASPLALLHDVRAMGETAAFADRASPLRRDVLLRAMALYHERFSDADGRVRATFELLTATGWAPHESQQKPLAPGSAKASLAQALGVREQSAGEKPGG